MAVVTTLLKAIKGSLKIKKGKIIIDGKDITNMPESKRSAFIAKIEQDPKKRNNRINDNRGKHADRVFTWYKKKFGIL